ncbi:dihydrofolate reductase family protein [Tundrisphaera sp. TA3]|uniref:dihydrofolate reductase family protein n=1 Tax=Tundrisphaera sp. TA3 TaxID=3435775 RepID=UPI003EB9F16D
MPKVVVRSFACSLDGFGAGLRQTAEEPFGRNAFQIMNWFKPTRTFQSMIGREGGTTGLDDAYASRAFDGIGASIMGRNMFSPLRGPWENEDWKGWWGDNPPFKHPVFVMTHHPRPTLAFGNGTSFHFVGGSPEEILKQAQAAAGDKDVKINGGTATVRAFWQARLIDELHLAMAPVFVGEGERLLGGIEGYEVTGFEASDAAVHYRIVKQG